MVWWPVDALKDQAAQAQLVAAMSREQPAVQAHGRPRSVGPEPDLPVAGQRLSPGSEGLIGAKVAAAPVAQVSPPQLLVPAPKHGQAEQFGESARLLYRRDGGPCGALWPAWLQLGRGLGNRRPQPRLPDRLIYPSNSATVRRGRQLRSKPHIPEDDYTGQSLPIFEVG
jgi:hypothetical protein